MKKKIEHIPPLIVKNLPDNVTTEILKKIGEIIDAYNNLGEEEWTCKWCGGTNTK